MISQSPKQHNVQAITSHQYWDFNHVALIWNFIWILTIDSPNALQNRASVWFFMVERNKEWISNKQMGCKKGIWIIIQTSKFNLMGKSNTIFQQEEEQNVKKLRNYQEGCIDRDAKQSRLYLWQLHTSCTPPWSTGCMSAHTDSSVAVMAISPLIANKLMRTWRWGSNLIRIRAFTLVEFQHRKSGLDPQILHFFIWEPEKQ